MSAFVLPRITDIPQCSRYSAADYDESRAAQFDPRESTALRDLAPSTVGGLVLGSLCAAAALSLAAWLIWTHIKKRPWKHELQSVRGAEEPQGTSTVTDSFQRFPSAQIEMSSLTGNGLGINMQMGNGRRGLPRGAKSQSEWGRNEIDSDSDEDSQDISSVPELSMTSCANFLFTILTVATMAACVWAAIAGARSKNNGAVAFWRAIDMTQQQVAAIESTVSSVAADSDTIRSAFQIAHDRIAAGDATLPQGLPSNTTALLQQSAQLIEPIVQSGEASLGRIQTYGSQVLQSFEREFRGPSQRTRRLGLPIVFPVCYSVLAAACLPLAILALLGTRPRLTGWLTILLWLLAGFLLLFGAGVLQGSTTVTKDSCLYAEAFAYTQAYQLTASLDPTLQKELIQGLQYYLGLVAVRVSAVAPSIYGIDFGQIDKLLKENPILQVTDLLTSKAGRAFLGAPTQGNTTSSADALHTALSAALVGVSYHVATLTNQINVETFNQLHQAAKEALCCTWSDDSAKLFASWTTAGVLSWLFCAALSLRVHSLVVRPGRHGNLLTRLWHCCC